MPDSVSVSGPASELDELLAIAKEFQSKLKPGQSFDISGCDTPKELRAKLRALLAE